MFENRDTCVTKVKATAPAPCKQSLNCAEQSEGHDSSRSGREVLEQLGLCRSTFKLLALSKRNCKAFLVQQIILTFRQHIPQRTWDFFNQGFN